LPAWYSRVLTVVHLKKVTYLKKKAYLKLIKMRVCYNHITQLLYWPQYIYVDLIPMTVAASVDVT
jgi:hypothetical protein